MKLPGILLTVSLCSLLLASDARLSPRFRTVYILEMSNSLDQHLASRLSSTRVLWVVLDPASADAVLTDSVDAAFWTWMQRTYPPGVPAPTVEHGAAGHDVPPAAGRRGTVFLVDPRKRLVLWSTYELPKDGSPSEMDRVAARITNQLKSIVARQ